MKQRELKKKLKMALRNVEVPANREHLALTKLLANKESCRFIEYDRIGFADFLSLQIRFIGWKIWAVQGVILVAISCFLAVLAGKYFMDNPRYAAFLLCCMSVLVLLSALPFINRSMRYKMHEIEAVTRFSSVKLLTARLLIVGIGDMLMLICILCLAVLKTPLSASSATLYLLFPFLLSCCGLLYLLNHIPAAQFVVSSVGLCFFLFMAFSLLPKVCPAFYQQTFSIGWVAICILLIALCLFQFRQLFYRCSYAEMQLI